MRNPVKYACFLLAGLGSLVISCGGDPASPTPEEEKDGGVVGKADGGRDATVPSKDARPDAPRSTDAADAGGRQAIAIVANADGWVNRTSNSLGVQGGWSTRSGAGSAIALTITGTKLCFRGDTAQVMTIGSDAGDVGDGGSGAVNDAAMGADAAGDAANARDAGSVGDATNGVDVEGGDAGGAVDAGTARETGSATPPVMPTYDYATYWGAAGSLTLCQASTDTPAEAANALGSCSSAPGLSKTLAGVRFNLEGTLPRELRVVFREKGGTDSPYVAVRSTGQVTALIEEATATAPLDTAKLQAIELYAYPSRGSAKTFDFCVDKLEMLTGTGWTNLPDWVQERGPGQKVELAGVSMAGAEFGETKLPGTVGTDYIYPSDSDIEPFAKIGMNVIRLPFRWERLERTLGQPFDAEELERLKTAVNDIVQRKMHVVLDPHNYARYQGGIVGVDVEASAFASFWSRLASLFADNDLVIFGLMNEPHDMSTETWLADANAAIAAIRETGAPNLILVPGNGWTGAHSWSQTFYGTANSVAMGGIVDPKNRFAFELHQYLDADSSGVGNSCVSETIGVERLQEVTEWLRAGGYRGFLGELGGPAENTCLKAIDNMLTFVGSNADVWMGWTAWAGGPWWGESALSLQPRDNGKERSQVLVLKRHLGKP